tara:strand:+ start:825 stop:1313 length:489 start_codon:yes stop_codon:yes gene_type:complete
MDIYFNQEELEDKLKTDSNELNVIDSKNNCYIEIKLNINNQLIFNCNCLENSCIHVDNFINYMEQSYLKTDQNNSQYSIKNKIDFPIKSDSDESLYLVSIFENMEGKIDFSCSCGLKFNIGYRKKCKHIKNTINIIKMKSFENNNKSTNNLSNLISNLEINP